MLLSLLTCCRFFCLDTYPLAFFAIYLKSLGKFTIAQINTYVFPG
jgi:hypothetical protein